MTSHLHTHHAADLEDQLADHGRNARLALSTVARFVLHQRQGCVNIARVPAERGEHDGQDARISNECHMALPAKLGRDMRAPLYLSALDKVTPSGRPAKVVRWGF